MVTLESLKQALRQQAQATSSPKLPLSDTQYSAGFDTFVQGSAWTTYQDFIIPQLTQLLASISKTRNRISVLEIGPGRKSVLGYLPGQLRRKITRYTAFELNGLFATGLEQWLSYTPETESPLPGLEIPPSIHQTPFALQDSTRSHISTGKTVNNEKYDIVLFCHSMYGMKPKRSFIEQALEMLVEGGMVVVFHRDGALHLDGLVCHRTACFPTGVVSVVNDDETLDCFATFVAGFVMQHVDTDKAIRVEWRKVCRSLGRCEEAHPNHLVFSSSELMVAFTHHATALPELTAQVPLVTGDWTVKNREARLHRPASLMRPTEVRQVQQCVRWAVEHRVGLTVVGGGHSGQCLWPNVVSVDMSAFDEIHIIESGYDGGRLDSECSPLVVAGAGCKTGDIISKTMATGFTVPLGSRPSVGAGLWLQGGIGHLARLHGLACDAIIGAVVVSVHSGEVLYVGCVPTQYRPAGVIRPENEADLLWAIKGAGTNYGIVVSVTFRAFPAPTYSIRNWVVPLEDGLEARLKLSKFYELVASKLDRNFSSDAYLYSEAGQLHLGVTILETCTNTTTTPTPTPTPMPAMLGQECHPKIVNGVGLFDTEKYVSDMHGGHAGGKTSSFKRCLFLKNIGEAKIAYCLVSAIETRPSPFCYLHLLHGGGASGDVAADATAFGCRDWDFACVVTGVWPRDQDGTGIARSVEQWVYNVVTDLLPLSSGAYSADLGPDPRDDVLAAKAFGLNGPRLARLKHGLDPYNILCYACPLPKATREQKIIILVTGKSGAGKDYCADVWVSVLNKHTHRSLTARAVSISDATKQEYAAATGADVNRLLSDRAYKEEHRPALDDFYQEQKRQRPQLPEEHFLSVVRDAVDVDVLLITGMRDEAPVASFSHLVPESRLLEVHVQADEQTRHIRGACDGDGNAENNNDSNDSTSAMDHCPTLIFNNVTPGNETAKDFAEQYLLPFFNEDLERLAKMVRSIPDFPRPAIDFRHVLGIVQHPSGLSLCTALLQTHFLGTWANIDALVSYGVGSLVFAPALALKVNVPLVLIRDAGKLPPPTVSVTKASSHISALAVVLKGLEGERIEMESNVLASGASVLVVDDVLATGETLCAVLQLLGKAGIGAERVSIMAVAEFPAHGGRALLRRRGFGGVRVHSLLGFGGV
ncbi:phosphoribosyl transferase domain protein [Clathrospora elynae]|uniref:Phosphoribosyl transferase domain protein n=1 Tax=Clathrospora elynae TaxID=706981 RepID=A0A6A5S8P1_9PLEO|nr:phosphoribosyl transferase domain protein [Clathrospora elynae]